VVDRGVAELLSDRDVRMRALLSRALGVMPDGQARELVLASARLLEADQEDEGARTA
jgi:hypothetical protein